MEPTGGFDPTRQLGFGNDFIGNVLDIARRPLNDFVSTLHQSKTLGDPTSNVAEHVPQIHQSGSLFDFIPKMLGGFAPSVDPLQALAGAPRTSYGSAMPLFSPSPSGDPVRSFLAQSFAPRPLPAPPRQQSSTQAQPTTAGSASYPNGGFNGSGDFPVVLNATSGYVTDHGTHEGGPAADIFAPEGSPIYAPVGGTVVSTYYSKGGNTATIKGDNGKWYYMAHGKVPFVSGRVERGQQIGQVGNTGNAAGGPTHVHFAITTDGNFDRGINGGSGNVWFGQEEWSTTGQPPPGNTPTQAQGPQTITSPGGLESVQMDNSSPQAFVQSLKPLADAWSKVTGIPALVYLAAAGSESNYGKAPSIFGIKASPGYGSTSLATREGNAPGGQYSTTQNFSTYQNINQAFEHFSNLVTSGRYKPAYDQFLQTGDVLGFLRGITHAGYAEDQSWGDMIYNMTQSIIPRLLGS